MASLRNVKKLVVTVPGGFFTDCNRDSLNILKSYADKSLKAAKVYDKYQFKRVGYFSVDTDTTNNQMASLRNVKKLVVTVHGGFLTYSNQVSLNILKSYAEKSLKTAKVCDKYQFKRVGFFSVDSDTTNNQIASLRNVKELVVTVPGGFLTDCNRDSLNILKSYADKSLKTAKVYDKHQFERVGFFSVDTDTTNNQVSTWESSPYFYLFSVGLKKGPGK